MFSAANGSIGLNANALKRVWIRNQKCKVRRDMINIYSNEPLFYPFSVLVNKCSGSCDNINDSYAKLCVPEVIKDIKIKVFNLMW